MNSATEHIVVPTALARGMAVRITIASPDLGILVGDLVVKHGGDVLLWKQRPRFEVLAAVGNAPGLFALYARAMFTRSAG